MPAAKADSQKKVTARIEEILAPGAEKKMVSDVRIGLGYTAVMLDDGGAGVAYTFRDEIRGCCSVFHALRPISGRPASELLSLVKSSDPIEAAVGLACANALANRRGEKYDVGDILDYLDVGPGDSVGMVGHFQPIVERLKARAGSLIIFERLEEPKENLRPVKEAGDLLPKCQVALITATSIINQTIDELLKAVESCRQVAILGASTPMLPEAFAGSNATILSGVVVEDPKEILRVVSEGGGMRPFKPYIKKINLRLP